MHDHRAQVAPGLRRTPVQVEEPDWSAAPDTDPEESRRQRRALLHRLLEPGTTGFGIPFADVAFGRAEQDGPGYRRQPLPSRATALWLGLTRADPG